MEKVKIVLVGIGGYGALFVNEVLDNSALRVDLAGVVDPFSERCPRIDELKSRNIPVYADMESFYSEKEADLAVISTPIFLHAPNILTALNHGSNVLCEKPLCADEKDIDVISKAQKESGKFVYIGYQWSYSECITKLKNDILNGKFGALNEMKTLVLRPRNRSYFGRGVGWAGKIKAANGALVYDSIANNSAAHYLFNMIFVMGEYGKAALPTNVSAELLRVNDIENFDVSKINFSIGDANACFIGAHPVKTGIEPVFEYRFEKGTVYYSARESEYATHLMPKKYEEYGQIVAFMNDGERIVYGDPMADNCKKLRMAVDAIINGKCDDGPCGVAATGVHTRLINLIQKECTVENVKSCLIKEENDTLYAEGLFEQLVECYKDTSKSLKAFDSAK